MPGIVEFMAALAAMVAVDARAQDGGWTSDESLRRRDAEVRRACRAPAFLGVEDLARMLAGSDGGTPCRARPALALRFAQALAGRNGDEAADGYRLLADLHARGIGVARDEAAALELRRRAWMLKPPVSGERPFVNAAETEAWLAQEGSVAFLRRYSGSGHMPLLRARLARALFVRGETAEATSILEDPGILSRLRRAVVRGAFAQEPRDDLAFFAFRRLAEASTLEQRREAVAWLGDAAFEPDSPYRDAFWRQVTAANGGIAPETLSADAAAAIREGLRPTLRSDDYPPAALRAEEQGRIRLRGLVDPDGRLIFTEAAAPGQSPRLLDGARRIYAQRPPPPVARGALATTPYFWVELPPFLFLLPD